MNHPNRNLRRYSLTATAILAAAVLQTINGTGLTNAHAAEAEKTAVSAADKAWSDVEKGFRPPVFPEEWQKKRPSQEEYSKFILPHLLKAGRSAVEFTEKFPTHPKAKEAMTHAGELLSNAANLGSKEALAEVSKLEETRLKDKSVSEDDRFKILATQVQRTAMAKESQGMPAVFAEFELGARRLIKEFPQRSEPYGMLLEVASNSEPEKSKQLAEEISASKAPDEIKDQAKAILKKMDIIGKPLPVKFKAVDGRDVDVQKMKGKVVLIDFWATWCGPCVQELPNVLAAYEKLHPKGFEIVGISFDQSKESLTKFTADKKMAWVQYFDGKGWQNEIGKLYGINSIPAMWLVDKKGNVRDLNARDGLADKVAKMLAE